MASVFDDIKYKEEQLEFERQQAIEKALRSDNFQDVWEAKKQLKKSKKEKNGPQGLLLDPNALNNGRGYYERNSKFRSYEALETLAKTPIIASIISTRIEQISRFTQPQTDKYSMGFTFRKKKGGAITENDKGTIEKLTDFVLNCGDDNVMWDRDNFDSFVRKVMYNSLSLDQGCFQVVYNKGGEPVEFFAMDGKTIRIINEHDENAIKAAGGIEQVKVDGHLPKFVQIYRNEPVAEFYPWEMGWLVRNPSVDLKDYGYGMSELEILLPVIIAHLQAEEYNNSNFNLGSAPSGIIIVNNAGEFMESELMRNTKQNLPGSKNANRLAVMEAEDFKDFIPFKNPNKEMEYSNYINYLVRLMCAMYKIAPEEINMHMDAAPKLADSTNKEEIQSSKDKGLVPLLKALETVMNKYLVGPKTKYEWEFTFVGIDVDSAKSELEKNIKRVQNFMTIDEIRKENGLAPLPEKMGEIVLNPIMIQLEQMNIQKQQIDQQSIEGLLSGL